MKIGRRLFVAGAVAAGTIGRATAAEMEGSKMHGLIGKMIAHPGKRDDLAAIMLDGVGGMPGCLSYVVAIDPKDGDALWITEVWVDAAAHAASLKLPAVQAAIARGRPLIASFGDYVTTTPLGGHGLAQAS